MSQPSRGSATQIAECPQWRWCVVCVALYIYHAQRFGYLFFNKVPKNTAQTETSCKKMKILFKVKKYSANTANFIFSTLKCFWDLKIILKYSANSLLFRKSKTLKYSAKPCTQSKKFFRSSKTLKYSAKTLHAKQEILSEVPRP